MKFTFNALNYEMRYLKIIVAENEKVRELSKHLARVNGRQGGFRVSHDALASRYPVILYPLLRVSGG